MRLPEPSVAQGALALAALSAMAAGGAQLVRAGADSAGGDFLRYCAEPVELLEEDESRLACIGDRELVACAPVELGDRLEINGGQCRRISQGMALPMRMLLGLPVDVNQFSVDDFTLIKGIGPALAESIVSHRERHGRFEDLDELEDVRGIGPKLAGEIGRVARGFAP